MKYLHVKSSNKNLIAKDTQDNMPSRVVATATPDMRMSFQNTIDT